jgi:hypothetical protein
MHLSKVHFIIFYYSPTCLCRFCGFHQDGIQEYSQYKNVIVYSYIVHIGILIEGVLERKTGKRSGTANYCKL